MILDQAYKRFSDLKNHGIICPLSFIKTNSKAPIGEFKDLIELCDFSKKSGFQIIQLLPIFDTGPLASPYSARSCFALHPIYLSLQDIPYIDKQDPDFQKLYTGKNDLYFDFQQIYHLKMELLKKAFLKNQSTIETDLSFKHFCENEAWLLSYAIFCAHKETTDVLPLYWHDELDDLKEKYSDKLFFYQAVQFYCYKQFKQAIDYVHSQNMFILGDIPILLSPDSCEMWTYGHLFDHTLTVGAPPDDFSKDGQSWGFPLMRFLSKPIACAQFWRSRVDHLSPYFDLYRIDHMVGFFRLWAIPNGKSAKDGFFFPQDENLSLKTAEKVLEILFKNTPMAPIAEDLGVIPDYVKSYIHKTHLCGTKVLRWERLWHEGGRFIPLEDYPKFSMACVSTHDTTFMFEDFSFHKDDFVTFCKCQNMEYLQDFGPLAQKEILKKVHSSSSLFVINLIHEFLYLHEDLKEKLPRINDPSDQKRANWCTRMPIEIEKLSTDDTYLKKIQSILGLV
jgi:4-alpha-glucanotransferase